MFISGKKVNGKQEGTIICIVTTINNSQPWNYRVSNANFVKSFAGQVSSRNEWVKRNITKTYDAKL